MRNFRRSNLASWIVAIIGSAIVISLLRYCRPDDELDLSHPDAMRREDLEPGDILLFRSNKKSLFAAMIRWWTKSPYSHAAIYLGGGKIFEAIIPRLKINNLKIQRGGYISVLRSQYGFDAERQQKMRDFAQWLINNNARYDLKGVLQFTGIHHADYEKNIESILDGTTSIRGDERSRYFCSALVARILCDAGIADRSAWGLFLSDLKSPGDISSDVNFGWFRGYLIPPGTTIPDDEPMQKTTKWKEVEAVMQE